MAKKDKQQSQKKVKKILLKEIETKLGELVKDYRKKVNEKKFSKELKKVGKKLSKFIAKETITVVHKKKEKAPKKVAEKN